MPSNLPRTCSAASRRSLPPDPVRGRIVAGDTPRPPAVAAVAVHQPPVRFVHEDDVRAEHSLAQRLVGGGQVLGQGHELVPQRLGVGVQALAPHRPRLALQRQVIEVLGFRDVDGELRCIPPARCELEGTRRGDHGGVAGAAVLGPLVGDDLVGRLDDGDLLGVLALLAHRLEPALTDGTRALVLGQGVGHRRDRQQRLRLGTVAAAGLAC